MNGMDKDRLNDWQIEQLKKEQKRIRKIGVFFLILSVILMPIVAAIHFGLVGISAVLAVIGGFLTARSYVHVKYQNLNQQK